MCQFILEKSAPRKFSQETSPYPRDPSQNGFMEPPPKKKTLRSVSVIGHPHLKGGPTPISTGFVLWILYDFVGNPSFAEPTDETPSTPRLRSAG